MNEPHELTPEELAKTEYGPAWARYVYNDKKCAFAKIYKTKFGHHQCHLPPGHGPGTIYCKRHAKLFELNR